MVEKKQRFKDTDMQSIIGWVLRIGVIVSISIVVFGGVIYLHRHNHIVVNNTHFRGLPGFMHNARSLIHGVITLRGQAIIELGIILLIATPIFRVAFSAIGFLLEKDYLYVGISSLVLLIIFVSMMSGYVG